MRHERALFQDILESKEIIKGFNKRVEDACIEGYWDGSVLWRAVDRRYGSRKWGCIFSVGRREVAKEEGHPYQFGWQNFPQGLMRCGERVHGDR